MVILILKGECFNTKDFIDNYAVRLPQKVCYEDIFNPHNSSGGGDTTLLKICGFCPVSSTTIIPQNLFYLKMKNLVVWYNFDCGSKV